MLELIFIEVHKHNNGVQEQECLMQKAINKDFNTATHWKLLQPPPDGLDSYASYTAGDRLAAAHRYTTGDSRSSRA